MRSGLVFVKDGVEYMKLCLDVTVYWTGSIFGHRDGLLHFYRTALDVVGGRLQHYKTGSMTRAARIGTDTFDIVPGWLGDKEHANEEREYILILESHPAPNRPSDTAFWLWGLEYEMRKIGAIRLMLPVEFVDGSPDRFQRLAAALVAELAFHSGHGGYAVSWDFLGRYASTSRRAMRALSTRFPGIELPHVAATLAAIPFGIKRMNWLTFLGAPLIERLGGTGRLNDQLGRPDASVEELKHGVMITAGNEPGVGDVNRREVLEPYHAVGAALAPIRSHHHPPFLERGRVEEDEATERWLGYFD
jgi:hypothetical protein